MSPFHFFSDSPQASNWQVHWSSPIRWAAGTLAVFVLLIGGAVPAVASAHEPDIPRISDPTSSDSPQVTEGGAELMRSAPPTGTPQNRYPDAAVLSDAVTAGLITEDGRQYVATRTSSPARLLVKRPDGGTLEHNLPNGIGSWDLAHSGDVLAVGIAAEPGADTTWVRGYDMITERFTSRAVSLKNAQIVMSIAEDVFESSEGNGRFFWAGTYGTNGARLFRIDLASGSAEERGSWPSPSLNYVRSLSVTSEGVTIGLGTTGGVARITSQGAQAKIHEAWSQPITGTSFAYAQDSAALEVEGNMEFRTVVGTEQPGKVVVYGSDTESLIAEHTVSGAKTIDRVTIDVATRTAWFTTRPYNNLYSLDLLDPNSQPEPRGQMIWGSETRALTAHSGVVSGITGTSETWTFDSQSGQIMPGTKVISSDLETPDAVPQGVARFQGSTLVAGHWRYQVHNSSFATSISVPGEPKAETVVGDRLYAALYPSGSVYAVNRDFSTERIATTTTEHMRPSDIQYNSELQQLMVAIGPSYGTYGGAVMLTGTTPGSEVKVYVKPVGEQRVNKLEPHRDGAFLGTSTAGEAMPHKTGASAQVRYWRVAGDNSVGTTVWSTTIDGALQVTGIKYIEDERGGFLLTTGSRGSSQAGWIAALDASSGDILWQRSYYSVISSLDQHRDYVIAVVNGRPLQIGATRTDLVMAEPKNIPAHVQRSTTFAALERTGTTQQRIALVSSGSGARASLVQPGSPRVAARISGMDRYQTAVAISQNTYNSAETVLLVRGDDHADALAAAPLAAKLGAPILLTQGNRLSSETRAEISRLGVKVAIPVGGAGVVPNSIAKSLPKGVHFDSKGRLGGANRYSTSLKVAQRLEQLSGEKLPVMVATGLNYADALAAGPAAIHAGKSIVLYDPVSSAKPLKPFLKQRERYALGGPGASALRSSKLQAKEALIGADRYDTAKLIAQRYFPRTSHAYVAFGLNFPDGLSAGVLAGRTGAPLLLSRERDLTQPTHAALQSGSGSNRVTLVGGEGVLTPALHVQIRDS